MSVVYEAIKKKIEKWRTDEILEDISDQYQLGKYIALDIIMGTEGLSRDEKIRVFQEIETVIGNQKHNLKFWRKEEQKCIQKKC